FAALILWYDQTRFTLPAWIAKPLAAIGCWSYSIYLLEYFVRLWARIGLHMSGYDDTSPVLAIAMATLAFCGMALIGALSYTLIEKPLLSFRIPYLRPRPETAVRTAAESPA